MLSEAEKRRYRRHIMLENVGQEGQLKLKNARVLVVGAGGLGAPVLQYLAAAGVGHMAIMDYDLISEDNLHRQILYGGEDLGKLKTITAQQKLKALNPLIQIEMINIRLTKENAVDKINKYDLIIDATDNFTTRYLINDACILLDKPWIYGSVWKSEGQVSVFNYRQGPTLRCLFPDIDDQTHVPAPAKSGLFGILPGITGSFQANEAIKIITGTGEVLSGVLLLLNILNNQIEMIQFPLIEKNRNIKTL